MSEFRYHGFKVLLLNYFFVPLGASHLNQLCLSFLFWPKDTILLLTSWSYCQSKLRSYSKMFRTSSYTLLFSVNFEEFWLVLFNQFYFSLFFVCLLVFFCFFFYYFPLPLGWGLSSCLLYRGHSSLLTAKYNQGVGVRDKFQERNNETEPQAKLRASLVAQRVMNLPAVQDTWI